jgi:hypothetical protein
MFELASYAVDIPGSNRDIEDLGNLLDGLTRRILMQSAKYES